MAFKLTEDNFVQRLPLYMDDFPLYAEEVLKIQDKDGELVPFKLNRAQRRVWSLIKEDLDSGRPVRHYYLKARQLGFSTMIQGIEYWLCSLRPNRNGLVTAHEDTAAKNLFLKSQVFYKHSPEFLRPMLRLSNRQELHFANPNVKGDPGLESKIIVQTANNRNLGASQTIHVLHMSEFAKYEHVLAQVKTAIATVLQAVPKRPGTFIFMETTADGMGYGFEFWQKKNRYRKVFISWLADESYRAETPLTEDELGDLDDAFWGNEIRVREQIIEELKFWYPEHADDAEWLSHESLCRLRWRREMIADQLHDDVEMFCQEYPTTAEEAFLTSGRSAFKQAQLRDRIYALKTWDANGKIETGLVFPPTAYRFDKNPENPAQTFYRAPHGNLRVYEPPRAGGRYVIGGDVAEGIRGGDYSVAQVLSIPDLVQVAIFRANDVEPDDFADALYALGVLYQWAPIAVEANGPGLSTNLRLSKILFYPQLYMREVFDSKTKQYQKKVGWHMNSASKNVLVNDLRGAVRDDLIQFRDLETLEEMTFYVQHKDGKFGAVTGKHDDCVIALGLALQMGLQRGVMSLRKKDLPSPIERPEETFGTFAYWAKTLDDTPRAEGFHTAEYYRQKFGR